MGLTRTSEGSMGSVMEAMRICSSRAHRMGLTRTSEGSMGSVMEAMRICSSRAHPMGLTRTAGGRMGSGVEGSPGAWIRERESTLIFLSPGL